MKGKEDRARAMHAQAPALLCTLALVLHAGATAMRGLSAHDDPWICNEDWTVKRDPRYHNFPILCNDTTTNPCACNDAPGRVCPPIDRPHDDVCYPDFLWFESAYEEADWTCLSAHVRLPAQRKVRLLYELVIETTPPGSEGMPAALVIEFRSVHGKTNAHWTNADYRLFPNGTYVQQELQLPPFTGSHRAGLRMCYQTSRSSVALTQFFVRAIHFSAVSRIYTL